MNKTETNCQDCGIKVYETFTIKGRCSECNLQYKIDNNLL